MTSAVAEGDLTRSVNVEASGEVAELKDNINAMVESLRETTRANQEQDWLKTNLARVSGLMQGHRDLPVVAELIMDELVPLVSAQYGAFYLADDGEDGPELRLVGSYGYPDDDERPTRIPFGKTLVGQAARSRRTILVDQLPPDYVTISSGLGQVVPTALVLLPIVVEGQVLGVIELASVTPFTQIHQDFLAQLMETIGVNVNTIVANARTDELLVESQRLTAELQERSAELQTQQEELQRSNAELEDKAALLAAQNRDIEAKNLQIEQARQELEARAQQLSLASKYKSEFLANMSHELRTPLNSLLILAQLLAQNPSRNLSPKQVEYAQIIHSAGSDLLQLINDILDLSKVEAGKMDVSPERVELRRLVEYVEVTFRPMTMQKSLDFTVTTSPGAPADLLTDDSRLRQVLRNLLSNAVKFTERGQVELRIEPAPDDEVPAEVLRGGPVVAFRVRDTGVGIQEQHLESIFGAFQQADGTTSRKYGGTGLGLSITREIAHLLGGAVTVDSVAGQGSTFTLFLPVARPDFEQQLRPAPAVESEPAGEELPEAASPGRPRSRRRPPSRGGVRAGCWWWRSGPGGCSPWSRRAWCRTSRTRAAVPVRRSTSSPPSARRRRPARWPPTPATAWCWSWAWRRRRWPASWRRCAGTPPWRACPCWCTAGTAPTPRWRRACATAPRARRWSSCPAWTSCGSGSRCTCRRRSPATCCRWCARTRGSGPPRRPWWTARSRAGPCWSSTTTRATSSRSAASWSCTASGCCTPRTAARASRDWWTTRRWHWS
ncbi:Sensor histidine kinase RcsC [Streptomyces griseoloalbus]